MINPPNGLRPGSSGKPAAAAAAFERALLFQPADPGELHQVLAGIYVKLGDAKKAEAHRTARVP